MLTTSENTESITLLLAVAVKALGDAYHALQSGDADCFKRNLRVAKNAADVAGGYDLD